MTAGFFHPSQNINQNSNIRRVGMVIELLPEHLDD